MLNLNIWAVWHCWVAHLVSHINGRTQDESALEHDAEEDICNNENFYDLHFHSNASDWPVADDEMVGHVTALDERGNAKRTMGGAEFKEKDILQDIGVDRRLWNGS